VTPSWHQRSAEFLNRLAKADPRVRRLARELFRWRRDQKVIHQSPEWRLLSGEQRFWQDTNSFIEHFCSGGRP
jgi:hypothetical protein